MDVIRWLESREGQAWSRENHRLLVGDAFYSIKEDGLVRPEYSSVAYRPLWGHRQITLMAHMGVYSIDVDESVTALPAPA